MKVHMMVKHAIAAAAVAALAMPVAAQEGPNMKSGAPSVTVDEGAQATILSLAFGAATETKQFYIDVSGSTGKLTVDTKDCCIANDKWGVELIDLRGGLPPVGSSLPKPKAACGTGETTKFTGKAVLGTGTAPFNGRALLIVSYCRGVDSFGAGMEVRVNSNGAVSVSPRGSTGP